MNERFPLLSIFAGIVRVMGLLVFGGGVFGLTYSDHAMSRLLSVAVIVVGMITAMLGECVYVIFAIEANTRRAADAAEAGSASKQ